MLLAQVSDTFSLALEDYYGAIASATSGGTCSIQTPSPDISLSEAGRFAPILSGVSTFTQFDVSGTGPNPPHNAGMHRARAVLVRAC